LSYTTCAACQKIVLELGHGQIARNPQGRDVVVGVPVQMRIVHPKAVSRSLLPAEVPTEFTVDYSEACLVLPDSENASAALSRRCLQHLLREKSGAKKGDLTNEIQQVLDSGKLPTYLAEDLDAIRNIGNFAAHPVKATNSGAIVDVEPHEAEWLLNVLEGLFDFYFVQPARAQAKRAALNAKLRSMGKPPLKTP
jgi:Domain of unknown function (DUF4145)